MSARVYAMRVSSCRPRIARPRVDYIVRYSLAGRVKTVRLALIPRVRTVARYTALYSSTYSHCTFIRARWRGELGARGKECAHLNSPRCSRQTEKRLSRIIFENMRSAENKLGGVWAFENYERTHASVISSDEKAPRNHSRSHLSLRKRVTYLLKKGMRHDYICR